MPPPIERTFLHQQPWVTANKQPVINYRLEFHQEFLKIRCLKSLLVKWAQPT